MKTFGKIILFGLLVCLIAVLGACTSPSDITETDTETDIPTSPEQKTDAETEAVTEAVTETQTAAETDDPNLIPAVSDTEVIGVGNVATEGFAMAGSTKTGTNIYLNDGNTATGFVSGTIQGASVDTYVFIDLTARYTLRSVVLFPMTGAEDMFPRSFDVQISDNFTDWTTVQTVGHAADIDATGLTLDMGGVQAAFVRLKVSGLAEGKTEYALGEMQVMADITRTSNMVLVQNDMWLYIDTTAAAVRSHLRVDNAASDAQLRFMTADSSIVTVDHETGVITPTGYGDTTVYVYDGINMSACKVKVIDERETDVRISTFYHSSFGNPEPIPACLDYMKEAGIEFLEETRTYDAVGNQVCDYMMYLCAQRGIFYSVCDPLNSGDLAKASDERVIALVQKYENRAGFGGIYLTDEPHEDSNQYAHVANVIRNYNYHVTPHLNMLPIGGFPSWEEYISDYCAIAGGTYQMQYLSYDNYCFMAGSGFNWGVYNSLNKIRTYGLKYHADTGYYMQCMEIRGNYRISSDTELMLNASMGIAYGMKNFKWFVYLTPIGSGEAFTTGMIAADFTPSVMYEGVKAANARIQEVGKVLGNADAIEVYHSDDVGGNEKLPSDFVITQKTKYEVITSLYQSRTDERQYVVIVNRNYAVNGEREFVCKAMSDVTSLEILSDGVFVPLTMESDGSFTVLIPAGDCIVLRLPEGYDARRPAFVGADNLALDKAVFVTSSQYTFWTYTEQAAWRLTDGNTATGWSADTTDKTPSATVDLGSVMSVSRVVLFAAENRFPKHIVIEVSTDGSEWTSVYDADTEKASKGESVSAEFDTVKARYVRISTTQRACRIAEIEIYP